MRYDEVERLTEFVTFIVKNESKIKEENALDIIFSYAFLKDLDDYVCTVLETLAKNNDEYKDIMNKIMEIKEGM